MTKKAEPARKTIGMHIERRGGGNCGGTRFQLGGGEGQFINGKFVEIKTVYRCLKCHDIASVEELKLQHNPVTVPDGNL